MSTDEGAPANAETRQIGEFHQERAELEQEWRRQAIVREAIRHVNHHLAMGNYGEVASICRERLAPALDVDTWSLSQYHGLLADSTLAWDWEAINRFLEASTGLEERASNGDGVDDGRRVIHHAAKSLESVAVAAGYIDAELSQASTVLGYQLQLGQQWHGWEYDNPDTVRVINPSIHPPFTMCIGDPGNGKSTAVDTIVEDAYQSGQKIIDLVDFSELENGVYDVDGRDEDMLARRREYGLPTRFEDAEGVDRPRVEILHPLCESLCEAYLPYDTESERYVCRPFVIPCADLDHTLLKAFLGDLSPTRENALNQALAQLDESDDWDLHDLAQEVLLTEADDGVKRRLLTRLDTLHSHGFLKTRDHEHAIDWEGIFRDTETITVFTYSMLAQKEQKLMAVAYLTDAIFEERMPDGPMGPGADDVSDYPTAMMVAREMQKIAPSERKMKGNTNDEQRLKSRCIGHVQTLGEERRHTDMGITADTQQWIQVNAGVRENVDRVVMFKLKSGVASLVLSRMTGDNYDSHANTISGFDVGEAAVVGAQWLSTDRDFEMPITWMPPLCHHLDADEPDEPDGWRARVRYKDSEELRPSPYSHETRSIIGESNGPDPAEETPEGFEPFVDLFEFTGDDSDALLKSDVYETGQRFAEIEGYEGLDLVPQVFGKYFRKWFPEDAVPTANSVDGEQYAKLRWRPEADRYREAE